MTVVPLVFASLVVGVAGGGDGRTIARLGWRALVVFVVLMLLAALLTAVVAQPVLALLPVNAGTTAALRAAADSGSAAVAQGAARLPGAAEWLVSLVPANPVRAAADGAMLPLIVFALAFGVALLGVAERGRSAGLAC